MNPIHLRYLSFSSIWFSDSAGAFRALLVYEVWGLRWWTYPQDLSAFEVLFLWFNPVLRLIWTEGAKFLRENWKQLCQYELSQGQGWFREALQAKWKLSAALQMSDECTSVLSESPWGRIACQSLSKCYLVYLLHFTCPMLGSKVPLLPPPVQ